MNGFVELIIKINRILHETQYPIYSMLLLCSIPQV